MAKSSRASTIKANNQRLKKKVFGPVETARVERLSAKLLEIAAQPKPERPPADEKMDVQDEEAKENAAEKSDEDDAMDLDAAGKQPSSKKQTDKRRIEKRRGKKSSIVFPKYGEKKNLRKKK